MERRPLRRIKRSEFVQDPVPWRPQRTNNRGHVWQQEELSPCYTSWVPPANGTPRHSPPGEVQKVLFAITSCHKQRHYQQSQRETWIKDIPRCVDYKFFLGMPNTGDAAEDEVFLGCGDGYYDLTDKTKAICRWALEHGYTFIYKTDTDTLVYPTRLLECGFENWEYTGGKNTWFASGGSGYCLSKRAMQLVADDLDNCDWEDIFVEATMRKHGINLHDDRRFQWQGNATLTRETIAYHISSIRGTGGPDNRYTPELMHRYYEEGKRK